MVSRKDMVVAETGRLEELSAVDNAPTSPGVGLMDEGAFLTFYRRTAGPLRAYAARVLGDAGQADDIVQDAYLRMLRTPARTDDPQQLRALLFRIASNLIVDHWRKRRRDRDLPEGIESTPTASSPDIPLRVDMSRMFRQLRPRQRQLLWLAYVEGAEHKEIAQALGLGERSVRVLLHRAKRTLAGLLKGTAR
jgi:RNA polymerase sigma-70 factor (ECF subfamily)